MNWLLSKLAPYPEGYVPYMTQDRIERKRIRIVWFSFGFFLGALIMFWIACYWVGQVRQENDEAFRQSKARRHSGEAQASSLKDTMGDEVAKRTMAENELRRHGIPIPKY